MITNRSARRRMFRLTSVRNQGMTLLEVMLALALTAVVLVTISMAIDIHLRMLDARRGDVERIQVARAVVQIISNDLRSVIQQNTTDFSALASMASGALASGDAADALDDAAGDDSASGGSDGDSSGGGNTGGGNTGGGNTGGGNTGGGNTGGGSSGGGNTGGTGSTGNSGSMDVSGDAGGSTTTEDIANSSTPPAVPGLYGNQYELQIDVSRIPRVDEMQRMVASDFTTGATNVLQDIPSDVKTVAYYYYDPRNTSSSGDFRDRAGNPQAGLVRRVLDRAVTLHASESTSVTSLNQQGEIIAPEIGGVEFQYFDGSEWLYEWDSEEQQGLPVAVRVTILLGNPEQTTSAANRSTAREPLTREQMLPQQVYSVVVRLPTALPTCESESTDSSGMESVGL